MAEAMRAILHNRSDVYTYEGTIAQHCTDCENPLNYTACAFSDQGRPLGIATMQAVNEFSVELIVIAVVKDAERNGIGSALLSKLEEEALRRKKIFLMLKAFGPSEVDPESQIALNFFRKNEICILGEYDFIWEGYNCAMLAKRL
ncbi:MAG: GNAT family N-acetyltransferase [Cyanobacteria bacterium SZAS LIN-3]|nr:GNAT family N-acetyltransferase [Cyanobacteria bacterium SZAS LIN-3]